MPKFESTIFLFDVDGTLTPSRQKITPEILEHLKNLRENVEIGFVGGSNLEKQQEQICDEILELFDYSFPENGLSFYRNKELVSKTSIVEHLGEDKIQEITNESLGYLSKIKLPFKRGNFIELRDSIMNVSPVGRSCSLKERKSFFEYDKKHLIREKYCEYMREKFDGIRFCIGGQISIDIFPDGWDKTYCLNHLDHKKIIFFGDMVLPGQNDYEIYSHDGVTGIHVKGPEDTVLKSNEILRRLENGEDVE